MVVVEEVKNIWTSFLILNNTTCQFIIKDLSINLLPIFSVVVGKFRTLLRLEQIIISKNQMPNNKTLKMMTIYTTKNKISRVLDIKSLIKIRILNNNIISSVKVQGPKVMIQLE